MKSQVEKGREAKKTWKVASALMQTNSEAVSNKNAERVMMRTSATYTRTRNLPASSRESALAA